MNDRPGRRAATWLVGVSVAAALIGPLPFVGTRTLVASFYSLDDNFYYLQIARHVAGGHGFTFDGIHRTNGFQPLWQFILVPTVGFLPGEVAPLLAVTLLESTLVTAAAILLFRILLPRVGTWPALASAVLLVAQPGAMRVVRAGMEGSLLLLLLVAAWGLWLSVRRRRDPTLGRCLILGIVCALAFLARLEALLTVPTVFALQHRRLVRRPTWALALAAPAAVAAVAYVAWNRIVFDTWLPVSAYVKAFWFQERSWMGLTGALAALLPVPWAVEESLHPLFDRSSTRSALTAVYWAAVATGAAAAWWRRRHFRVLARRSGAAFSLLSAALITFVHAVAVGPMDVWQRVPLLLAVSGLAAMLLYRHRWARPTAALVLAAALTRVPLALWQARRAAMTFTGATMFATLDGAQWLMRNTSPEDRIGSWNSAGTLAHFSGRHVVNLDGLTNDVEFFRSVVRGGRLAEYLQHERISLLAEPACGPYPRIADVLAARVLAVPMDDPGGSLRAVLRHRFELAAAFPQPHGGCPGFAVWRRLDPPSAPEPP